MDTQLQECVADALARAYDGQPLADMRDEHAVLHMEAAEAVIRALCESSAE